MLKVGTVYVHNNYLKTDETYGRKLLLCVGHTEDEVVFVVATSQPHTRPENVGCNHTHKFPHYFCAECAGNFSKSTWLDLGTSGFYEDYREVVISQIESGTVMPLFSIKDLPDILSCVVNSKHIRKEHRKIVQQAFATFAPPVHGK